MDKYIIQKLYFKESRNVLTKMNIQFLYTEAHRHILIPFLCEPFV